MNNIYKYINCSFEENQNKRHKKNFSTKIVRNKSNHNENIINSVHKKETDINANFILNRPY